MKYSARLEMSHGVDSIILLQVEQVFNTLASLVMVKLLAHEYLIIKNCVLLTLNKETENYHRISITHSISYVHPRVAS